ncbi:MAG: hypothetical protein AAGI51_08205 [Pseudomonadota bacterium]
MSSRISRAFSARRSVRALAALRALLTVAAAAPTAALAQGGPPPGVASGPWILSAQGGAVHQFESGIDGGGDVSVTRWFVEPSVNYGFDRRTSIGLSLGYGETTYDFSGGGFAAGEPWDRIRDLRISAPIRFGVTDQVSAFVLPTIRWNAETGADLDDGRTEGVIAAGIWRVSDSLSIGPGFGVFSGLEDDVLLFPFLVIDWNITDRFNLGTGGGLAATQGPGLTLTYRARPDLTLGIGGRFENIEFALDDSGIAPNGTGREQAFPVFATAEWRPLPTVGLSAVAGVEFGGELRLKSAQGRTLRKADYDPAPFLGLTGSIRF